MAWVGFALYLTAWVAHGWLTFSHRYRLGSEAGDSRQDPTVRNRQIEWGLRALWIGQGFAAIGLWICLPGPFNPTSVLPPALSQLAHLQLWPNDLHILWSVTLGTVLTLLGVGLRLWAIRTLGRLFTFEIGIRAEHRIIESGPYRWLRHPSYTGYLLLLAGMALLGRSLGLWLGTVAPAIGFLVKRIIDEERMLHRHFGAAYAAYSKKTWRLLPGVF